MRRRGLLPFPGSVFPLVVESLQQVSGNEEWRAIQRWLHLVAPVLPLASTIVALRGCELMLMGISDPGASRHRRVRLDPHQAPCYVLKTRNAVHLTFYFMSAHKQNKK